MHVRIKLLCIQTYVIICVYVHTDMYVCMNVCVHECMYVRMHACMHAGMDGWMDGWMDGCGYYISVYMYVRAQVGR